MAPFKGKKSDGQKRRQKRECESAKNEETSPEDANEELIAVSNVKCVFCQKKGHYASQCPKKQEYLAAKGKGKGKDGGGKGKGKG